MDKIMRIDMGAEGGPQIRVESLGDYAGLGGRGLTSTIVAKEVPPLCHPLGEHNKLVIAPGLLSGTAAAMSGRISVGCKSPLTGGIKEANAGGQPSQMLGRLGYAAIILEGKPKDGDLYKIYINKEGIKIIRDETLRMLPNYDLVEKMKAEYGDKISCISIGPAGEMKMAVASVACTDPELRPTRHAARGGVGAVMGAKGVKVIVIDDTGMKNRAPQDPEKFNQANKDWVKGLKTNSITGEFLPNFGTAGCAEAFNEAGAYPTYNFKQGQFDEVGKISGQTMAELEKARGGKATHGCHRGCVIRCSGIYHDKDGHFVSKQPEYETAWAHGGHCGISDPDAIATFDFLEDNYGLDTIDTGVALGVAMDAGLIKFGDVEAAINLVKEVGKGTPVGRIIGSGAAVTAKVLGVERVAVVKGQAFAGYDPRAIQGIGVTYATSPMGADHTAGYTVAPNIFKVGGKLDPLSPEGQVAASRDLQIATAALDSTGMCLFVAFAILDQPETFQAMLDLINSGCGLNLTAEGLGNLGKSVLRAELDFNRRAGFTSEHDRLPDFFKREKLPPHDITFLITDEELDSVLKL
jgi:aldehyde:ferredoxin oxidoreductase